MHVSSSNKIKKTTKTKISFSRKGKIMKCTSLASMYDTYVVVHYDVCNFMRLLL